jgi:hypothetical protein
MTDVFSEDERDSLARSTLERYWRAAELAADIRAAWEEQGQPLTVIWENGTESEAPLLKLLRDAERDAARFAKLIPLSAARPGRPPVATIKPPTLTRDPQPRRTGGVETADDPAAPLARFPQKKAQQK